ncbi:MAG: glycosyltransferase family 39 protein, partial [Chloroflexi bacterium]|nr:glycosyltransferase family 39 protein [Chloroflexota bacterium]
MISDFRFSISDFRENVKSAIENRKLKIATNTDCLVLALILLVAAFFRFQGLDWDRGYLFHPDERQILFVTSRIDLPANALDLFSADSPLNPKFFSYGSLPIYLLKALGAFAPPNDYPVPWRDNILVSYALLGRALSGLFDLGTIVFAFLLGRRLYSARVGLLAAAGIAVTVLHIQLSHFYAVDTLLTFFVVATMFFAARYAETGARRDQIAMAVAFGLAMATKLSAFPLIVPIAFAALRAHPAQPTSTRTASRILEHARGVARRWLSEIWRMRKPLREMIFTALAVFFVVEPYALLDPIRFFGQAGTEGLIARGWMDAPYTRQYADTLAYVYPIAQSTGWGMGAPLGIAVWVGSALFVWSARKQRVWRDVFVLSFALVYFVIVGAQYAKHLRYLLPLIPFLFLMAVSFITHYATRNTQYVLRIT